jgi:uncharacterized protein YjaG (DUF416 family)
MEQHEKKVDESWKEAVRKETDALKKEEAFIPPEPDFSFFVTTLALQASIALGSVPNPATKKTEVDLTQAKFLIDTLGVIQTKTHGNLTQDEQKLLDNMLYELKLRYVQTQQEKRDDRQRAA